MARVDPLIDNFPKVRFIFVEYITVEMMRLGLVRSERAYLRAKNEFECHISEKDHHAEFMYEINPFIEPKLNEKRILKKIIFPPSPSIDQIAKSISTDFSTSTSDSRTTQASVIQNNNDLDNSDDTD